MSFIKKNEIFLLGVIVKRNFLSKYKESVLGVFWTVLNPLMMMALFTILFSTLFKRNIDNFPVFFLCGWSLFIFFNSTIVASMNALKGNRNILQRTPAPKYIFILGGFIAEFLNFLIMFILLIGIMIITNTPFHFTMFFAFIPIIFLSIACLGIGFMLSIVCVYYTDIQYLWSILSMLIMYGSGIFYPMDIIPEPYYHYLILNPFCWVVGQFRCFVYEGVFPPMGNIVNTLLLSLIILVFGIIVFKKYEAKIAMKF